MLTYEEALAQILSHTAAAVAPVQTPLAEALGLVLAEDFSYVLTICRRLTTAVWMGSRSAPPTSPFAGTVLPVQGDIAAGALSIPMLSAATTALRIMTGAPVPDGADTVVPVEDTEARARAASRS